MDSHPVTCLFCGVLLEGADVRQCAYTSLRGHVCPRCWEATLLAAKLEGGLEHGRVQQRDGTRAGKPGLPPDANNQTDSAQKEAPIRRP